MQELARGYFKCPRCGDINQANWVIQDRDGTLKLGGCSDCHSKQADREWFSLVNEIRIAAERYEAMIADLAKFEIDYYGNYMLSHPKEDNPIKMAVMIMQDRWSPADMYTPPEKTDDSL